MEQEIFCLFIFPLLSTYSELLFIFAPKKKEENADFFSASKRNGLIKIIWTISAIEVVWRLFVNFIFILVIFYFFHNDYLTLLVSNNLS